MERDFTLRRRDQALLASGAESPSLRAECAQRRLLADHSADPSEI